VTTVIPFPGLQYAYLNNDNKANSDVATGCDDSGKDALASQSSRSEITLDELSNLYRNEEEEELRAGLHFMKSLQTNLLPVLNLAPKGRTLTPRDEL
jgi:hypothetical protein